MYETSATAFCGTTGISVMAVYIFICNNLYLWRFPKIGDPQVTIPIKCDFP